MNIFFLMMSLAFAETPNVRNLKEQTYTRDNTYCNLGSGKEKIEIQIRSIASKTEPDEKKYGEHILYYPTIKPKLLPLNSDNLNNYRLFEGKSQICSKSLAFMVDKDIVAILFLKENRPDRDKLTIQLFNTKNFAPDKVIETDFMTDEAEAFREGFIFNNFSLRDGLEMGKIQIQEKDLIFQDRDFPTWVRYDKTGFETLAEVTFDKFEFKSFFKDQKDFFISAGWDDKMKKFNKSVLYVAINKDHSLKCILLTETKSKLSGNEADWHCQGPTKAE